MQMLRTGLLSIDPSNDNIEDDKAAFAALSATGDELQNDNKDKLIENLTNVSEESYYMLMDAARDLNNLALKKTHLDDAFCGVKQLHNYMSYALDNGGVTATDLNSVVIPMLNHYAKVANVKPLVISTENFKSAIDRSIHTSIAMESIGSMLYSIWEAIKKFINAIIEAFGRFFKALYRFFTDSDREKKKIDIKLLEIQNKFADLKDENKIREILKSEKYQELCKVNLLEVPEAIIISDLYNGSKMLKFNVLSIDELINQLPSRADFNVTMYGALITTFNHFCVTVSNFTDTISKVNELDKFRTLIQNDLLIAPFINRDKADKHFIGILFDRRYGNEHEATENNPFSMDTIIPRHGLFELNIQTIDVPKALPTIEGMINRLGINDFDDLNGMVNTIYSMYSPISISPLSTDLYAKELEQLKDYVFFDIDNYKTSVSKTISVASGIKDNMLEKKLEDCKKLVDESKSGFDHCIKAIEQSMERLKNNAINAIHKPEVNGSEIDTHENSNRINEINAAVNMLAVTIKTIMDKGYQYNSSNLTKYTAQIAKSTRTHVKFNAILAKALDRIYSYLDKEYYDAKV